MFILTKRKHVHNAEYGMMPKCRRSLSARGGGFAADLALQGCSPFFYFWKSQLVPVASHELSNSLGVQRKLLSLCHGSLSQSSPNNLAGIMISYLDAPFGFYESCAMSCLLAAPSLILFPLLQLPSNESRKNDFPADHCLCIEAQEHAWQDEQAMTLGNALCLYWTACLRFFRQCNVGIHRRHCTSPPL